MSAVVGIDLGTTNTVVAHVDQGRATALADEAGERLIPSVVSFHPSGQVIVGRQAKERRLLDATSTVFSVKRLIGRAWDSDDVKRARSRFPFELREGPGHAVLVVARGETYTLSEISAYVLRKAKAVAEAALGQPVERAVVTVPANFNDLQRAATKVAGRVAGLEVLRILNEPTAAALAYGYGKSNAERIAIYDFGGGTFDVTLLDLSGNVFEVLATSGDTFLGGDDVDLLLADRISDAFLREHRYDPRTDPQAFEHVRAAAEKLKLDLSISELAEVHLDEIAFGPGGRALSSTFGMSRADFEALIRPLVDRTFNVCRDALATARAKAKEFDQVILVGGSTRIPLVRRMVAEYFDREPLGSVSPDEVVAIGAAIQAMALTSHERRRGGVDSRPGGAGDRLKAPTLGGLGKGDPRVDTSPGLAAPQGRRTDPGLSPGASGTARGLGAAAKQAREAVEREKEGRATTAPDLKMTERAPSTADFAGAPAKPAARPQPPPLPPPRPAAPSRPQVPDAATKLSLGAEAQRAASGVTTDSVADALPLIGAMARPSEPEEQTLVGARKELPLEPLALEPAPMMPTPMITPAEPERPVARGGATQVLPVFTPPAPAPVAPPPDLPLAAPVMHTPPPAAPVMHAPPPAAPVMHAPTAPAARPFAGTMPMQVAPQIREMRAPSAPLLVDVTPLSLSVETLGGYCDVVIARNTPVPCDRTRVFVTAKNFQRSVRVNVAQGESARFGENVHLGEVVLSGIREGVRGDVEIEVTFEIDSDGLLQVRAKDVATGKQAQAQLRLKGLEAAGDAEALRRRQASQVVV
ncbi:MAG: Hsp70 family protein [Polyangiaceae bacterium]|nr:Hsp70 family protein [Polyangiaceae bacterium]